MSLKDKSKMDKMISSEESNEYVNSITHLVGAVLSIAGLVVLIVFSALQHKWVHLISFSIYGFTVFLSMLASSLLHFFLLFNKYHRVFGILDHSAIYLLIAGTYTPFCLAVVGGVLGWTVFGIIWGLAILNIVIKSVFFNKIPKSISTVGYIAMGWLSIVLVYSVYVRLGLLSIILMILGGLFYTIGAGIFFAGKPNPKPPYFGNHEIWHIMVLLGNITFFAVMVFFVLPYPGP